MPPLTEQARYQIEHDLRLGLDNKAIAKAVGKSVRTIERERHRCEGDGEYTAARAIAHRLKQGAKSAANHPTHPPSIWQPVDALLKQKHSPAQVEAAMAKTGQSVSASAIYRYAHQDGKAHLLTHFRHYTATQKRRGKMHWVGRANKFKDRPKEVLTRDAIGHLECDSIVGKRNEPTKVVVLLDRATRFVRLGLVRDGTAAGVARHMSHWLTDPLIPCHSLTTDQGVEFSALPELIPSRLYACDPGKPYQKGAVEHMNKLIRQYIPKGKSLRTITQAKLDWIANELNNRIRYRLGWESPVGILSRLTAATTSRTPTCLNGCRGAPMLAFDHFHCSRTGFGSQQWTH